MAAGGVALLASRVVAPPAPPRRREERDARCACSAGTRAFLDARRRGRADGGGPPGAPRRPAAVGGAYWAPRIARPPPSSPSRRRSTWCCSFPAGLIMDQRGRTWTAIPSTLVLSVGLLALSLTTGLATLSVAAVMLGVGNGWGSGLIMTLGSDVAPAEGRTGLHRAVDGVPRRRRARRPRDRVAWGRSRRSRRASSRRGRSASARRVCCAGGSRRGAFKGGGPLAAYQFAKFWTTYHPLELCAMPIPTWWKVVRRMLSLWWGEFIKAVSARLARPSFGHPLIQ